MAGRNKERCSAFLMVCDWKPWSWLLPLRPKVLMLKTIGKQDVWEYPGGHKKSGDVSLIDAAIRKTMEETGLKVTEVLPGEIYRQVFGKLTVVGYVGLVNRKGTKVTLNEQEHPCAEWFSKPEDVPWPGGAPDSLYEEFAKARAEIAAYRNAKLVAFFKKAVPFVFLFFLLKRKISGMNPEG